MSGTTEADETPGFNAGNGEPGPRLSVFVSSTLGELSSEREAAKSAIKTLRLADSVDDPALQAARHNGRQMNPFDAAALVLEAVPVPA